jgi:hypothetical protein
MKNVSTKGGSGLPKASILNPPASKGGSSKMLKIGGGKVAKSLVKGAKKSMSKKMGKK